jgi:hypothetical protein
LSYKINAIECYELLITLQTVNYNTTVIKKI